MPCYIPSTEVYFLDSVIDRESFEYRTAMADAVSTIQHQTRCLSSSIKTQYCLLLEKDFRRSKLFEEDICCFDPIIVWIEWRLSKQNWVLLGRGLELIENVAPMGFHVIPVDNDSVLDGVIQL